MSEVKKMVAEQRNYSVLTTDDAKQIVINYIQKTELSNYEIEFGLPEINDRYDIWKVPLLYMKETIGDIVINAYSKEVDEKLSSKISVIRNRILSIQAKSPEKTKTRKKRSKEFIISNLDNMVIKGRAEVALKTLPDQSIDLIFTSPPYYNARKQYSEYESYDDYLLLIRKVIRECRRVLIDGKFFVINVSHVLVPRSSRNESSTRIAVPFDIHQIFMEEGFEFIDDIIWQKPEGAGWASGRGRRFAADRNPMQYKAVPVTEYVLVYRKKPCILIDHFIRNNPNPEIIKASKIEDDYEKTNVWYISPARDKRHPAIFPAELAEKVIKYYSFVNDVVLDPFGGIGTTAKAAKKLGRRFCTIEVCDEYIQYTLQELEVNLIDMFSERKIVYKDLSDKNDDEDFKSFEHLVHRLIHEGYSKDELYDALLKGINNIKNK
ncbi:MAG: site-specific DNA-methyltransferase [Clostridium thermopalmarium]|jgi:DNA modification methylase|uniref:DNA-methyltransferase n=1 Tax=Clostridium thermopalmarium TaxID=29373 RepID=UPI002354D36C|nr:site-specific DNA-methyltransferase [Clostridium thermopalmarium]MBE6042988.1 site-specific DNA-methyltransferase [Clostridium thermopalmarium]